MEDIGRRAFVPELGVFGTIIKQDSSGRVEEIQLSSSIYRRNAVGTSPIPTVISVIDISVVVIRGIITLLPLIREFIKLIKDER